MKNKMILTGFLGLFIVFGCNKSTDLCEEIKVTASFVLDYPDTVKVDVPFNLNVGYVVENSCGNFGEIEAKIKGNILEAKLKTHYEGCDCKNEFQQKNINYPIVFDEVGTYELRFWIGENEFETYIVQVIE